MPTSQPSAATAATVAPADVVVEFLEAWGRWDIDRVLELVTEDLEYINVSLPKIHGRDRLERLARPIMRPDRVDELTFRKIASRFWVYGRFTVREGQIAVWRDSFDWLDVTVGNLRGLLGLLSPALNRDMPGR